jgi:RNA exonuclease 1
LFSNALPTRAPGDRYRFHPALNSFLSTPVTVKEKERRNKEKSKAFKKRMEDVHALKAGGEAGNLEGQGEGSSSTSQTLDPTTLTQAYDPILFLLTPNQMIENEYPIPTYFPSTVEAFMKGDPGDLNKGNEVFLPWNSSEKGEVARTANNGLPQGWRETERAKEAPEGGKCPVLAVDCEMVSFSLWIREPCESDVG